MKDSFLCFLQSDLNIGLFEQSCQLASVSLSTFLRTRKRVCVPRMDQALFEKAVGQMEKVLREDPRQQKHAEEAFPRDFLYTRQVINWVSKLTSSPSESLLLAAWGHVIYRWNIPRDKDLQKYPMTTGGYHKWRRALAVLSAEETEKILKDAGYENALCQKVKDLILKTNFPTDPDSQVLEDADCLAFLELKFDEYLPAWDEEKYVRILKGTLEKMTKKARELALAIPYSPEAKQLLQKAIKKDL